MLAILRARTAHTRVLTSTLRTYATVQSAPPTGSSSAAASSIPALATTDGSDPAAPVSTRKRKKPKPVGPPPGRQTSGAEGALRPHLNIPVDANHGLWAFFRQKKQDFGPVKWETIEPAVPSITNSGRSWTANELRRKSFSDLHTLWYTVLRERNLLSTQAEEGRRMGAYSSTLSVPVKMGHCRKTMARIKYVLNERRLMYKDAFELQAEQMQKTIQKDLILKSALAERAHDKKVEELLQTIQTRGRQVRRRRQLATPVNPAVPSTTQSAASSTAESA